jgi:exoribonuclease R
MTETTTHEGVIRVRGKGTGFVPLEDFLEDILILTDNLGFALDGDLVEIELLPSEPNERRQGKVLRVVEAARNEIIGTVKRAERGGFYLQPDNLRIHKRPKLPDAKEPDEGMKVVVTITQWSKPEYEPRAEIIETLGKAGDHETEMQAIIRGGGFSENFLPPIAEAANELHQNQEQIFAMAEADLKRRDYRGVLTMTIDPHDAKDFDDALSLKTLDNGNYEVGIHIADVSHYVKEGDVIDMEVSVGLVSIW